MAVLGLTGLVSLVMRALPMPIVMAMVAGGFLQFGLDLVFAIRDGAWVAVPMTIVFLAVSATPAVARRLPPLIAAMAAGGIAIALVGGFDPGSSPFALVWPKFQTPAFAWGPMVELVIPLAVTVLAAQNAQGLAVLEQTGHKPPTNAITVACGLGTLAVAVIGTVPSCLTGAVTAIISATGEARRHYTAAVLVGALALAFGVFSGVFTKLMLAAPAVFISALAGLAMLQVLQRAFTASFPGPFAGDFAARNAAEPQSGAGQTKTPSAGNGAS
jgi:benzoate membrane transport protein